MKRYIDLKEDSVSNVTGQILAQRKKIEQRLANIKHLIAVGSGKGGVGKSTLVTQIASALHSLGFQSGILDLDFNGPTQARLCGLREMLLVPGESGLTPSKSKQGLKVFSFGQLYSENQDVDFASVARGESHTWRATKEFAVLADLLANTDWGRLDFLLIDLPPGAEKTFQFAEFFGSRADFIMITVPSAVSRGVVKRSLKALSKTQNRLLGVVQNMHGYYCHDCKAIKPLFPNGSEVELDAELLGQVPFDSELAKLCDAGLPIADNMSLPSAQEVLKIATRLLQILGEKQNEISVCGM